jgi:hypothetical protein
MKRLFAGTVASRTRHAAAFTLFGVTILNLRSNYNIQPPSDNLTFLDDEKNNLLP